MTQPVLEIGKRYLRRDKLITGPLVENPDDDWYTFIDPLNKESYTPSGSWSEGQKSEQDLIREAEEITYIEETDHEDGFYYLEVHTHKDKYRATPTMSQKPKAIINELWPHLYFPKPEQPSLQSVDKELGERFLAVGVDVTKESTHYEIGTNPPPEKAGTDKVGTGLILIPWYSILAIGSIFIEGLRYGKDNWKKGVNDKEYQEERLEHAMLHLLKWKEGDRTEPHLAKVAWFCVTQLELERMENESRLPTP